MTSHILVVDDEPGILESTRLLLSDLGFDVTTTSEHSRVLSLIVENRIDVLLQDLRMPGLDVDALVESIRADPETAGTRIVLFSASMDLGDVRDRLAVDGLLEKPFRPDELFDCVMGVIGARAAG